MVRKLIKRYPLNPYYSMKSYRGKIVNMSTQKITSGRRERKREQTKQGLLQAAFTLFLEKGYDETTIDDIVAAADMAKVTFYYYFRSKEEIIHEMKRATADETLARARVQLNDGRPAMEILDTLISDMCDWSEKNWRIIEVFAAQRFSPLKGKDMCSEEDTPPIVLFIEDVVLHGQSKGEFRKELKPSSTAHFFMLGVMHEHFMWMRQGRPENTLKPNMQRCLDLMFNGMKK